MSSSEYPFPVWSASFSSYDYELKLALRTKRWWLCAALIFLLAGGSLAADPARALKEMGELETQIEQAQRRQAEEQRRMLEAARSLQSVDRNLQSRGSLAQEGEQFLKNYDARAKSGIEDLERSQAADRAAEKTAQSALALTGARLAAESEGRVSGDAALLALGMLHELHRGRATLAAQRIQDAETRRDELAGKRVHAQESAAYQTVFSEYSLQQLRERHAELARQVAEAQAEADRQLEAIGQLAGRHEELKGLIAKLAEQEAARVAAETTETAVASASATPLPSPLAVVPGNEAAVPSIQPAIANPTATPAHTSAIPEVPYEEGSEPMASLERSGDRDQAEGTRHLFWRARPVGVCALAAGKVLFSGAFAGYRHLLIIDHGGGWRSLYGNMTQCALKAEDPVGAGQIVGDYQAGQGTRAEPLWFEVRQGAAAVAPETWPALPREWQGRILRDEGQRASGM